MDFKASDKFSKLLRMEAKAIDHAADLIDPRQVDRAIEILASMSGKVVLSGVGKSGDVSRKIVSTLNSTGTQAIFLHPTDALHGDLGIVGKGDAVIALSNSGETDEILMLLPHLQSRSIPIISIVGNPNSTLARNSDVVLQATVEKEACPLNLAPTTSTTVALAIGDALAMMLMEVKGWTAVDFALNHPAGRLGKRLTLRVENLMHKGDDNPCSSKDAPLLDLITAMSMGGLGAVNIVDQAGKLLGLVTDGDLRRSFQNLNGRSLDSLTTGSIMTPSPITIGPQHLASEALELMQNRERPILHLPVVDTEGKILGLVRLHDLVRNGLG